MQTKQKLSILVVIVGSILSAASIFTVVPRIRLVEAIGLFATAFGAGAALTHTFASMAAESHKTGQTRR